MQKQRLSESQTQKQQLEQSQAMRPLLQAEIRILRMSQQEFEQDIRNQLDTNPALEEYGDDPDVAIAEDDFSSAQDSDSIDTATSEKTEYSQQDYDNDRINDYQPDDVPSYYDPDNTRERIVVSQTSFYDLLKEQAASSNLTELQSQIMDYLIGSLDDDGFLRKSTAVLSDEMEIYEDIVASKKEVEEVLRVLQSFEPSGVGAKDLQESLIIQVKNLGKDAPLRELTLDILTRGFEDYKNKHYDKLCQRFKCDRLTIDRVYSLVRRLNPRPAGAMGGVSDGGAVQITPDFEVREADDGFEISLCAGHVPKIKVSSSYVSYVQDKEGTGEPLNEQQNVRRQVGEAKLYVAAVRQRQKTMLDTMKAIVHLQHDFFREGDRSLLRSMTQKDVADLIHRDPSTVSGVVSNKYADTPFGLVALSTLFTQTFLNQQGEEISREATKERMRSLIKDEDPLNPLSDDQLAEMLGIARRTVAKYRKVMHIPVARLRR